MKKDKMPLYEDKMPLYVKWIIVGVIAMFAVVLFNPIVLVSAGQRGVLLRWGAVTGTIFPEGLSFKTPISDAVEIMDVRTQKYNADASSASQDLQIVSTKVALNYHLDAGQVAKIYQELGRDYEDRIVQPAIQEMVKASTATFTAEELITKRPEVKTMIEEGLRERLMNYGVILETLSITNFEFSPEFDAAIEAKVTAQQLALKAENDLKRIQVEAQQRVAEADGQAEAKVTVARAEAEAIKIQREAIQESPEILQLRYIEKWNGVLPQYMFGQGVIPLVSVSGT